MTDLKWYEDSEVTLYKSNACDLDVARAAWVSLDDEAHRKEAQVGRVEGLINFLWNNGHTSPFEHGSFTFIVKTPIFVAREFMRHRTFSFNEVSGRYTELKPEFYRPNLDRPVVQEGKVGSYSFSPDDMLVGDARWDQESVAYEAWRRYESLVESGVAKEVARMHLPLSLMTTFWATANPLNVLKFLTLRTDAQALYEIRSVASQMERLFEECMPLTHAAWKGTRA